MATKETFRFTLDLPLEQHKRLKTMAALHGKSMRVIIVEALDKFYAEELNAPNAETRAAIEEAERGAGIIKCSSKEDLFKKLGI